MKIKIIHEVPDCSYFRMSDVSPELAGKCLVVFDGKGTRRSRYTPGVTSTVIVNTATFTAIHVGFHHKHRGGQGYFYFVAGQRKLWNQLSAYRKRQVIAGLGNAPCWAKTPGKIA